jgi:hypothetical protein
LLFIYARHTTATPLEDVNPVYSNIWSEFCCFVHTFQAPTRPRSPKRSAQSHDTVQIFLLLGHAYTSLIVGSSGKGQIVWGGFFNILPVPQEILFKKFGNKEFPNQRQKLQIPSPTLQEK